MLRSTNLSGHPGTFEPAQPRRFLSRSTLNPEAQKIAKQSVEAVQPGSTNTNNVNAALTSVEPGSGRVVAMAQNAEWVNPRCE